MISRTKLLLFVIFAYAAVLNIFVTKMFMQRNPELVRSVRRRSARAVSSILRKHHDRPGQDTHALIHDTPTPGMPRIGLAPLSERQASSCTTGPPAIVVAVAPTPMRASAASPDLRLLLSLRDMLRNFQLRVILMGAAESLTSAHRLWCSNNHLPCSLIELPPSALVAASPSDTNALTALTTPLLNASPCLDDIVLLHSALSLPAMFVRQLQRYTRPGKLTCLAATRALAAPVPMSAPCPALAYRVPRSFLLLTQHASGDATALAAQRGLLAPAAGFIKV